MATEKQTWRLFVHGPAAPGETLGLGDEEHHYAFNVLRLGAGEAIEVGDGRGFVATARLARCDKKACEAVVEGIHPDRAVPVPVTLFLAAPKPSTLEEVVSQASEMGVARLVVFRTRRCQSKSPVKAEKLARVALEALRVSKGPRAPEIVVYDGGDSIAAHAGLAGEIERLGALFLCDECPLHADGAGAGAPAGRAGHNGLLEGLRSLGADRERVAERGVGVAIGPEASFAPEERAWFLEKGARPVSLGPFILRVPTASAYAVALAMGTFNADWKR